MAAQIEPDLNEMFDLLTHPHRRYILYYLTQESETADVDTLAASLAALDADHPGGAGDTSRETIEMQLHHKHLPKLVDAGVITFARDEQSIALGGMEGHGQFIDQVARIDGYSPPAAGD